MNGKIEISWFLETGKNKIDSDMEEYIEEQVNNRIQEAICEEWIEAEICVNVQSKRGKEKEFRGWLTIKYE